MKHAKKHSQKKLIEKIFEQVLTLDLPDKEFKSTVFTCAQGTKGSHGEMVKQYIEGMMYEQVEDISEGIEII